MEGVRSGRKRLPLEDFRANGGGLYTPPLKRCVVRKRKDIAKDATRKEDLIIEVLLDIRDILVKATKKKKS